MSIQERLFQIASRIPSQIEHVATEEATKNAFVMPFIAALGYDVFNPQEVTPELVADVGTKKGEKVDYAIFKDGAPIMLFECKHCGIDLDGSHSSQLFRYFSVTRARIGVVTNGITYRFFSDLDEPNKMDSRPFLEVDMLALDEATVESLRKFSKGSFEIDQLLADANDLKYTKAVKKLLAGEMDQPTEEFVHYLASQVYPGRVTQNVKEQFTPIVRLAMREVVSERVSGRLRSALATEQQSSVDQGGEPADSEEEAITDSGIETTEEEIQAFYIVKAIVSVVVPPSRVAMRDAKSYCAILLDDNNRKTICRLRFNTTQKYVGTLDADKNEEKIPVDGVDDIYALSSVLRETVLRYEKSE